jgi:hypothetical protein
VYIVSGLMTYLETGESMGREAADPEPVTAG